MIASTKLFLLLTGIACVAVLGAGPSFRSDTTLTAMLTAGAASVVAGLLQVVRAPAR
jgi:hypothetical protein